MKQLILKVNFHSCESGAGRFEPNRPVPGGIGAGVSLPGACAGPGAAGRKPRKIVSFLRVSKKMTKYLTFLTSVLDSLRGFIYINDR